MAAGVDAGCGAVGIQTVAEFRRRFSWGGQGDAWQLFCGGPKILHGMAHKKKPLQVPLRTCIVRACWSRGFSPVFLWYPASTLLLWAQDAPLLPHLETVAQTWSLVLRPAAPSCRTEMVLASFSADLWSPKGIEHPCTGFPISLLVTVLSASGMYVQISLGCFLGTP